MGGVKKKSLASMEKKQDSGGDQQQAAGEKGKKPKEQKAAPQQQKRLPFLPPKMTEAEMVKALAQLKAITVYTASRTLGVNASIATGILRVMESKSLIRRQGGFSGHTIWSAA